MCFCHTLLCYLLNSEFYKVRDSFYLTHHFMYLMPEIVPGTQKALTNRHWMSDWTNEWEKRLNEVAYTRRSMAFGIRKIWVNSHLSHFLNVQSWPHWSTSQPSWDNSQTTGFESWLYDFLGWSWVNCLCFLICEIAIIIIPPLHWAVWHGMSIYYIIWA